MEIISLVCIISSVIVHCSASAYDDGKYHPTKYNIDDDGMYYRPLDEGKYQPGDEGKYTYVYVQGLYPDYPYIHQEGPNGGNWHGGDGKYIGDGEYGNDEGSGEDSLNRQNGGTEKPRKIEYIGRRIYAERFPYVYSVIKALINQYVSEDSLFGVESEGSVNHYSKMFGIKETVVKCRYLNGKSDNGKEEFTTQYPPRPASDDGKTSGSYYSFKGTKILDSVTNSANLKTTLKLEYEVLVRVVDEVTSNKINLK